MSNINDKATVSLFVNGEQAEAAMERLREKAKTLDKQLQAAMAAGDKKSANKLQREINQVTKELNKTESAAKGTGLVLDNLANSSLYGLRSALKHLERELKATKPNTEAWHRYAEQINAVKGRIDELNQELEGSKSAWGKFKDWAMDTWPAIDLLSKGYDAVVNGMRQYVEAYAEMDQQMANVRKFTGMSAEEVAALNEELKKIDTRTGREELNKLAQEAGRLGLSSQEDVLGFVRAADKINVALDDLGEGATLTLSKLTDMFGDRERYGVEQSLLKTGSVINELSQSSSAAAPYIANFAERMSGVGIQAGMTVPQIMALGAVLDSMGAQVEASSTAVSQVLVRMMQDPAKYARVAGLEVEKFSQLLKTDANEALLTFLGALNQAGGMDALAPMFKDMGESGARAIATLATLAKNIDTVRQRQNEANAAFQEGVSIDKEFDVQNNTVQAGLEKAKNRFHELAVELGERLAPLMTHVISVTSAMARAISVVIDFVSENKGALIGAASAFLVYKSAVMLANAETVIMNGLQKGMTVLWKVISPLITVASLGYYKLTGNIQKANVAQRALSMTMKSTPWGAIAAGIGLVVGLFLKHISSVQKARAEQREFAAHLLELKKQSTDYATAAEEAYTKEISALEKLYDAATKETNAKELRIAAVKKLQETYPQTFANFSAEQIMLGQAKGAYDELTESIMKNATARAAAELYLKNKQIILEKDVQINTLKSENKAANAEIAKFDKAAADQAEALSKQSSSFSGSVAAQGTAGSGINVASYQNVQSSVDPSELSGLRESVQKNNAKINQLAGERQVARDAVNYIEKQFSNDEVFLSSLSGPSQTTSAPPVSYTPTGDADTSSPNGTDRFAKEKAWKEEQEALNRIAYAKGEADFEQYTARMTQISIDYNQKLLDREDVTGNERLKIQADYWEAVNKQNKEEYSLFVADADESYARDLRTVNENYAARLEAGNLSAKEREALEKSHTEALEMLELEHLQNLLAITDEGTDERAKLEQQYLDARLKAAQRHQQEYEKTLAEHEKLLASLKNEHFGMNQGEKDAEFKKQFAALTEVYNQELAAAAGNEAEILRIKEAYMAAELALRKKYNQEGAEDSKSSYSKAIDASVEWLNGDGGKALTGTLSTLTSGMSSIFSGLSSVIQAELDIQTAKIERRYEREIELAQGNSYKVAKLEKQKEKDIAKAKNDANRKMFAMQVIQAVAQTATNALNAYGSAAAIPVVGHVLAPIAAAMAVAAGMIQVASIKKQQQASEAQGYSKGGFTKKGAVDEPAGIVHAGEWVASQKLLASPVARPMIEALDRAQRTNTIGSLKPEDVSRSIRSTDSLSRIAEDDNRGALMVAAFAQNSQAVGALVERLNEPIVAWTTVTGDHGIRRNLTIHERLLNNKSPKHRNYGPNN